MNRLDTSYNQNQSIETFIYSKDVYISLKLKCSDQPEQPELSICKLLVARILP